MKQEAFMSWDRMARSWRQLKDGMVFRRCNEVAPRSGTIFGFG